MGLSRKELRFAVPLLLATTFAFGAFVSLFAGIADGLVAGLFFGFFMTLILRPRRTIGTRRTGGWAWRARYTREFLVELSAEDAFNAALQALRQLSAIIVVCDERDGQIQARTGATLRSFGEIMRVTCEPITGSQTKVSVTSVPGVATTLVDYGKGLDNINKLAGLMAVRSGAPTRPWME